MGSAVIVAAGTSRISFTTGMPVSATMARNWSPYSSSLASPGGAKKRWRKAAWAGSIPTSWAWSQLLAHIPLKANTWVAGAAKQSRPGSGGGSPPPSQAQMIPLRSTAG